jgi:hypothetical protein
VIRAAAAVLLLGLAGCGSEAPPPSPGVATPAAPGASAAPAGGGGGVAGPPDAGTARGHGADRRRVPVPDQDATPPQATIVLAPAGGNAPAQATIPGEPHDSVVRLPRPGLLGTTLGHDADSGIARVRVSMRERLVCRSAGGVTFERARLRYVPPPQTERIRSAPGALLSTRGRRAVPRDLSSARCGPGAEVMHAEGEVWGEAINGLGLEAVTPHIRFEYRP